MNNIESKNKLDDKKKERHFKLSSLNNNNNIKFIDGKKLPVANIYKEQSPLVAAYRIFKSIMIKKDIKNENRLKKKFIFKIKETTRGSKNKEYGPYIGEYIKLTKEELEKPKGLIYNPTMKAHVKLYNEDIQQHGGVNYKK